jgi:hypothetical protein
MEGGVVPDNINISEEQGSASRDQPLDIDLTIFERDESDEKDKNYFMPSSQGRLSPNEESSQGGGEMGGTSDTTAKSERYKKKGKYIKIKSYD